jgi:diguanylate cyclase (GGDEF)-like protein
MKKNNFVRDFFTNKNKFPEDSPSFRRVYLLNVVMVVTFIVCFYYTIMNIIKTDTPAIVYVDGAAAFLTLLSILYFHKTNNIKRSTMFAVILFTITLVCFIVSVENKHFSLYWCATYPPVIYFLVGRKKAHILNLCFCLSILLYVVLRFKTWGPVDFGIESISNIVTATICLSFLVSYHEHTQRSVEQALAQKNEELALLAVTDYLTGLYNRSKIDSVISNQLDKCRTEKRKFSIILGDIDYFKNVNDTYGHNAGDKIIIDVSRILMDACNKSYTVGRWGGDEYLVICPDTDESEVHTIKENIVDRIDAYNAEKNTDIAMSLGTATYMDGDTADTLLNRADNALYNAKAISHSHPED